MIKSYMERRFPDRTDLVDQIEALPVLSEKDLNYLTELIEMVVGEIIESLDDRLQL